MIDNRYHLSDGTPVTADDIKMAVRERRAMARWSHDNWINRAHLLICETMEEAVEEATRDTRNECHSMWDEVWSELATEERALQAARGQLTQH